MKIASLSDKFLVVQTFFILIFVQKGMVILLESITTQNLAKGRDGA